MNSILSTIKFKILLTLLGILTLTSCKQESSEERCKNVIHVVQNALQNNLQLKAVRCSDTLETLNISLDFDYQYSGLGWELLLGDWMSYHLGKEKILKEMNKDSVFYTITYVQSQSAKNWGFYKLNINADEEEFSFQGDPFANQMAEYSLTKMIPSDFDAYDYAFEVLHEKSGLEIFNQSFLYFLKSLVLDEIDVYSANDAFDLLIEWTYERGDKEIPDHFLHFKSLLNEYRGEVEVIE